MYITGTEKYTDKMKWKSIGRTKQMRNNVLDFLLVNI